MFIGSLVLLLSAVQITFSTSIPVTNLLLAPFKGFFSSMGERTGWDFLVKVGSDGLAPPSEAIAHYNRWQTPFAIITSLLVAFVQYLRWKQDGFKRLMRQLAIVLGISAVIAGSGIALLGYRAHELQLSLLLFTTVFAAVANIGYIPAVLKGRLKGAGPSIAHTGFALVLLGALVSTSRTQDVSMNARNMDLRFLNEGFSNSKEILLYRGDTTRMGEFYVHYSTNAPDRVPTPPGEADEGPGTHHVLALPAPAKAKAFQLHDDLAGERVIKTGRIDVIGPQSRDRVHTPCRKFHFRQRVQLFTVKARHLLLAAGGSLSHRANHRGLVFQVAGALGAGDKDRTASIRCLLYTSPSPRDRTRSRMPSSA